ncbi:hypothetical protein NXW48_09510 [Phocaeicola vulgatus]|nr:hypothetical protein [Phocaeicola vulgatus]
MTEPRHDRHACRDGFFILRMFAGLSCTAISWTFSVGFLIWPTREEFLPTASICAFSVGGSHESYQGGVPVKDRQLYFFRRFADKPYQFRILSDRIQLGLPVGYAYLPDEMRVLPDNGELRVCGRAADSGDQSGIRHHSQQLRPLAWIFRKGDHFRIPSDDQQLHLFRGFMDIAYHFRIFGYGGRTDLFCRLTELEQTVRLLSDSGQLYLFRRIVREPKPGSGFCRTAASCIFSDGFSTAVINCGFFPSSLSWARLIKKSVILIYVCPSCRWLSVWLS